MFHLGFIYKKKVSKISLINVQPSLSLLIKCNKKAANEMRVIQWRSDEVTNQQIGWSACFQINQMLSHPGLATSNCGDRF